MQDFFQNIVREGANQGLYNFRGHGFQLVCALHTLINDWDKLPDETVEKILIQDIERFGHACETYKNIINSCSRFKIIKK